MTIGRRLWGLRMLRNPLWTATWALEVGLDRLDSPRHRNRSSEYGKYESDLFGALVKASGAQDSEVRRIVKEIELQGDALDSDVPQWAASAELVQLSYGLTRLLAPEVVVETGIGTGASSRAILLGLAENDSGYLHSIELPTPKAEMLPRAGYLVPTALHSRWTPRYGASRSVMPGLLAEVKEVGLFLHDSRHSYRNQLMEYRLAWPYLQPGGVLLSDDVSNDAFLEVAETWEVTPIVVRQVGKEAPVGLMVKPHSCQTDQNQGMSV